MSDRGLSPQERTWGVETTGLWPSEGHALLLEAAIAPAPAAGTAWRRWRAAFGPGRYEEVDWHTCRLLPAVYRNLVAQGEDDPWFPSMRSLCRHLWARDLVRRRELRRALGAWGAAGVPVLLLKGEALLCGGTVPRDGRRSPIDSDVLVRKEDIRRAGAILEAAGWRAEHRGIETQAKRHAYVWKGPEGCEIDVHLRLGSIYFRPLGFEALAAHAETAALDGLPVRIPSATDLLLHACVHGRSYREQGPVPSLWALDAAAILRRQERPVDWDRLLATAVAYDVVVPLRDALAYLHGRLALPVPAGWIAAARARAPSGAGLRAFVRASGRQGVGTPRRLWLDARDRYRAEAATRGEAASAGGLLAFALSRLARRGPRWVVRSVRRVALEGARAFEDRLVFADGLASRLADPGGWWDRPTH